MPLFEDEPLEPEFEPDGDAPENGADADAEASSETVADLADLAERTFLIHNDLKTRLDVYLQSRLKGVSRSKIQQMIELGAISVNDLPPKSSTVVREGDRVTVRLPPIASRRILPEPIPIQVLYEDADIVVINKQAGLIVHPARSNLSGTLINGLAYRFKQQVEAAGGQYQDRQTRGFLGRDSADASQISAEPKVAPRNPNRKASKEWHRKRVKLDLTPTTPPPPPVATPGETDSPDLSPRGEVTGLSSVGAQEFRPGIIHRLDKNTTGVIVVAKNDTTHWQIAKQFEERTTLKAYLAIVHGNPDEVGGAVEQPIGKHPTIREAMAIRHDSSSKHALTLYRVREQYEGYALVELELKTGRTHQIRVHLAYLGHPIIGDVLYGGEPVGHAEIIKPPLPAARRFHSFARDKDEGERIEKAAKARPDILIAHPALHATLLRFVHPTTLQPITFTAPLHEPMKTLVRELRKRRIEGPVATEGFWVDLKQAVGE